MKQILLMITVVALVGCGKNDPPPPDTSSPPDSNSSMAEVSMPEKETGKEVTQPTTPNIEAINSEPKVDPTKHGRFIWIGIQRSHFSCRLMQRVPLTPLYAVR